MKAFITFFLLTTIAAFAQVPRVDTLVSPEVHSDGRVTFRVRAPKASEVSLFGDWMLPETKQAMTRDEQGVWSTTIGPLEPGLAIYTFTVDGVTMSDPVNPRIKLRARTSASLVDVPGSSPELWEARDVPHGAVEVNWVKSKVTGDTRAYYVYTPPGYDPGAWKRYPVLYLLHGNNDTAAGWTDVGKANFILDNLISEKRAVPMVVVMPFGHAVPFVGPQSNNTAMVERYLIEEVMPQVEKKYRLARGRENRAVVGLFDGWRARVANRVEPPGSLQHGGGLQFRGAARFRDTLQIGIENPDATNKKLKLLWIGCGRQDSAFERNQKLSELLTAHKVRNIFYPTEGLHNFAIWRRYLVEVAPLLFRKDGKRN